MPFINVNDGCGVWIAVSFTSFFTSHIRQDPVTITQVLPTYINIYTYTIKHRNTFTINPTYQTDVNRP